MNKKIIIGIIAGVLAAAIVVTGIVLLVKHNKNSVEPTSDNSSASVSEDVIRKGVLKVSSAAAKAGESITVEVSFNENPGIWAIQLMLSYDTDALEYTGYSEGDLFSEYEVNAFEDQVKAVVIPNDLKNTYKNGTVIKYDFKVKDGVAPGEYGIKINDGTSVCNADEVTVEPSVIGGVITVK